MDLELTELANNTLTLLQAISGVYAIALNRQTPEAPLDVAEFQFTAALGQLLIGSPRYEDGRPCWRAVWMMPASSSFSG
ncbi:Uncharacterized protein ABJ99_4862 [Pseudomonas syringae pv. cilantro]|uniref:Uncharacterized protein n=1 Tax=Pseudomonas syringae pv. cilantro TaxID=81035 RepID=A0A0N0XBD1_PSESX|nr:Uncharacterized protein ABJ99_4862 [Pseudomonas syringae pv. cilantro]